MKKLLLFALVAILFSSCATLPRYREIRSSLDFDYFTEHGIQVSPFAPASENFEYVADAQVDFLDGYVDGVVVPKDSDIRGNDLYADFETKTKIGLVRKTATTKEIVAAFAQYVLNKNCNAIFNFQITPIEKYSPKTGYYRVGWRATGVLARVNK